MKPRYHRRSPEVPLNCDLFDERQVDQRLMNFVDAGGGQQISKSDLMPELMSHLDQPRNGVLNALKRALETGTVGHGVGPTNGSQDLSPPITSVYQLEPPTQ